MKNRNQTHLGQVIVFSLEDLLEAGDSLVDGHQLAGVVGEHLGDLKEICEKVCKK